MAKQIQPAIGARLPPSIIEQIDKDIESGDFYNRSDWVRQACREFYNKRVQQNNSNKS